MPITITVAEIAAAIRVGSEPEETAEVSRIRDYAVVAIMQYLGDAFDDVDDVVLNMACTLLTGWLYDRPTTTAGVGFANAIKFSGAIRTLFPYKIHNVGIVGGDAVRVAQAAVGTDGNPVVDVDVVGSELRITFADGSTEVHDLPAAGAFGTDQTARDSAATAQTAADTAQTAADTAQTDIDDHEANHPSGGTVDQVARDAASENTDAIDALSVPSDWALEGNTDPVPDDKINPTIRGHRVFVQTTEPTEGEVGDTWIQDSTNIPLAIYERTSTSTVAR